MTKACYIPFVGMSCDHNSLLPLVQNTLVGKPECSITLYDCLQQVWMTVTALHRMGRVNTPVLYVLEGPISGDCVQGRCLIFGIYSCASSLHFTGLCALFVGKILLNSY